MRFAHLFKEIKLIGTKELRKMPIQIETSATLTDALTNAEYFLQDVLIVEVKKTLQVMISGTVYCNGHAIKLQGEEQKKITNALLEHYKVKGSLYGLRAMYQ